MEKLNDQELNEELRRRAVSVVNRFHLSESDVDDLINVGWLSVLKHNDIRSAYWDMFKIAITSVYGTRRAYNKNRIKLVVNITKENYDIVQNIADDFPSIDEIVDSKLVLKNLLKIGSVDTQTEEVIAKQALQWLNERKFGSKSQNTHRLKVLAYQKGGYKSIERNRLRQAIKTVFTD